MEHNLDLWVNALGMIRSAEENYQWLLSSGMAAQDARSILPNCTKTEIVMTANLRQWFTIFKERAWNSHAQAEISGLMNDVAEKLAERIPLTSQRSTVLAKAVRQTSCQADRLQYRKLPVSESLAIAQRPLP